MDSATEDIYLQKIEEFIQDEEKVVTVRWLSLTLNINIAEARRLLEKYIEDYRTTSSGVLAVSYVLSGMFEENKLRMAVVEEEKLEEKSNEFFKILNKQVYSVQKGKEINLVAVSLVDCFDMHNTMDKSIKGACISKGCVKRMFKEKKTPLLPPPKQQKPSFFTKLPNKTGQGSEKCTAKAEPQKQSELSTSTETPEQEKSPKKNAAKSKNNGIMNFFTKGCTQAKPKHEATVEKNPVTTSQIHTEDITMKGESPEIKISVKDRISTLVENDSGSEDVIPATQNSEPKRKRSYKRKKDNKKSTSSPKKRRRIVENDSDSDDIFGNDDDDEELIRKVESDEEPEPVLKPVPLPLGPKNKRRKKVVKTYEDDDGYLITRKEWVEISGSEEEEIPVVPKAPESREKETDNKEDKKENQVKNEKLATEVLNGKSTGGKNKKGKKSIAANQRSIMSFFQKK